MVQNMALGAQMWEGVRRYMSMNDLPVGDGGIMERGKRFATMSGYSRCRSSLNCRTARSSTEIMQKFISSVTVCLNNGHPRRN